jgi:hypothetical protein
MIFTMSAQQPWLDHKSWAKNSIASGSRRALWVVWGFALFWNLLTLPLFFQFHEIWEKVQREPVTAVAFLFPLIGLGLIVAAVVATLRKKRFGQTPLVMNPFPGSLGGQVGGRINTHIPFDSQLKFKVSLSCIHSRISGSGKNRNRSESVVWQSDGVCHSNRGMHGAALEFRFDVPFHLPASQPGKGGNYHLWRLRVNAVLPGLDFDRSYEIPVFETGARSSSVARATESHAATLDEAMVGVHSVADIQPVAGGVEARFPAMQRPAQGIFTLLFGSLFAGIGIALGVSGQPILFAGVFFLVGTIIACYGAFYLGKSLIVSVTREGLQSRRFLFGYPLRTQQLAAADFQGIEIKQGATMQSGSKTTVFYQLFASGSATMPFVVAERLTSRTEAELLRETYITYLGKDTKLSD